MSSVRGFVKMYYFAIDFDAEMPYPLAPPQGWEISSILENKQLSNWQLAKANPEPKPQRTQRGLSTLRQ
jgi:hypothetical protein